jgi:hypothetical protein
VLLVKTQPKQWQFDDHEAEDLTIIRMAKYFGVLPDQIESMSYEWFAKSQAVINADYEVDEFERQKRAAKAGLQ